LAAKFRACNVALRANGEGLTAVSALHDQAERDADAQLAAQRAAINDDQERCLLRLATATVAAVGFVNAARPMPTAPELAGVARTTTVALGRRREMPANVEDATPARHL